jgi:hypothetical protein
MSYNLWQSIITAGLAANLPLASALDNPTQPRFYYATDTNILYRYNPSTLAWNGGGDKPVTVGATGSASSGISGVTYLLSTAAGSVLTLPAATGSGIRIKVVVITTATSGAHKVLTSPITDVLVGQAVGATAAGATLKFSAATAGAFHSIQMPFAGTQPSGGFEGDVFDFTDIAAGKWHVEAMYQSGTTATTPFSTATT